MKDFVIYNGSLIPKDQLLISPLNRGMMYGDGCFDTFRSYKGKFLNLKDHFERLISGTNYLGIKAHFGFEDFRDKILELLEANQLMNTDALVRVQCWRNGGRGYATNYSDARWITTCSQIMPFKEVISLSTVSVRAIPSIALDRKFKLTNGLNYIQAAREAKQSGADDALMLTIGNRISETTISNIFWVKGGKVFTPSLKCDLLPGITRNLVIDLVHQMDELVLVDGEFELEAIETAEAVFTTNSIREISTIDSLDEIKLDVNHPAILRIKKAVEVFKRFNLA